MATEDKIKTFAALVTLIGVFFGVYQFLQVQAIQAARPFLEQKLKWCAEAVEVTARISNSANLPDKDVIRFWQMYWGVMGLIENKAITTAMVEFGDTLPSAAPSDGGSKDIASNLQGLKDASLKLAHACRDELSQEWSAKWARGN